MTAGFYSFKVWAADDEVFPEHFLVLGEGENIFNTSVQDIEAFRQKLASRGVRIVEEHRLDDLEEVPPVTLDLDALSAGEGARLLSVATATRDDRGGSSTPRRLPGPRRDAP